MAHILQDRVKETTASTGTGSLTLQGESSGGFRSFASVMTAGDTTTITISQADAEEWEVCVATMQVDGTLLRGTTLSSSNNGAAVSFGAGVKEVFITLPAARVEAIERRAAVRAAIMGA